MPDNQTQTTPNGRVQPCAEQLAYLTKIFERFHTPDEAGRKVAADYAFRVLDCLPKDSRQHVNAAMQGEGVGILLRWIRDRTEHDDLTDWADPIIMEIYTSMRALDDGS